MIEDKKRIGGFALRAKNRRHQRAENVADERGDHRSRSSADYDGDRQVDDVSAQ